MRFTLTRLMPLALVVGLCMLADATSFAQAGPCEADAKKFCAGATGRMRDCLEAHKSDLSEGCQAQLAKRAQPAAKNPCSDDIEKHCKDVKPGEGRIIKCLEAHAADLSASCKAARAAKAKAQNPSPAPAQKAAPKAAPKG